MGYVPPPPPWAHFAPPSGISWAAWHSAWDELAANPLLHPPMGLYDSRTDWDLSKRLQIYRNAATPYPPPDVGATETR